MPTWPTFADLLPKSDPVLSSGARLLAIRPKPTISLRIIPSLDHSEALIFERFRSQAISQLAGVRSSSFWRDIVLPACYSEPAILHASMAFVGATRRQRSLVGQPFSIEDEVDKLNTVSEYNKAIQYLSDHVARHDEQSSLRVILITCVIFIALELASGRIAKAIIHLHEGRRLLQYCAHLVDHGSERAEGEASTLVLAPTPQSVEDELVGVFADLDLQSTYYGSTRPQLKLSARESAGTSRSMLGPGQVSSLVLPADFVTIQEAHQYFVILANRCLHFIGNRLESETHTLQNQVSNFHRQHLCFMLSKWRERYARLSLNLGKIGTTEGSWKQHSTLLLVQHAWLSLVISTSYSEIEEIDLDDYLDNFTTIMRLSSTVLLHESGIQASPYSLELGLVAPLWFTTMKCRHPQIRRQALRLLKAAPREGLWDPALIAQVAHEVIKLEEGIVDSLTLDSTPSGAWSDQDDHWRHMIPLERRISAVEVIFENEDYLMLIMTFKRKRWSNYGKCIGVEDIVVRQPYRTL